LRPEKGGARAIKIPEDILATCKEAMLQFGSFKPTLFVEGTNGKMYTHLPYGETNAKRIEIMVETGIQFAKSGKLGDVEKVISVSEAWTGPAREPYVPPSQDQNRQEVLLFSLLDARTNTQYLEMYACIRNWKQEVIDLKLIEVAGKGTVEVISALLPSFLAGYKMFKR
jgi:hypothetical protein